MNAEPLPHAIFAKALNLGITKITLNFSGGNDEGYLDVLTEGPHNPPFLEEMDKWAWEKYSYNGAGDGQDYGDTIVYDLANRLTHTSEWTMERVDSGLDSDELQLEEEDEE